MDKADYNLECHELNVLGTNGRVFRLKVADITQLYGSRAFIASLFLFASLIALNDQFLFDQKVALPWRLAYWNSNALLAAAIWLSFFALTLRFGCWLKRDVVVPSAILILATVTVLMFINYAGGIFLFNRIDLLGRPIVWEILRYTLIALVFETMSATFLVPRVLGRAESDDTDASGPIGDTAMAGQSRSETGEAGGGSAGREISHNGRVIDLRRLLYMRSVEHYVELVSQEGTEMIRASLRELANGCPPGAGIRSHRSYWVQRDAIVGLNRAEGGQFLVLRDGTEIPVARNRRGAVGDWLNDHVGKKRPGR
ncbi:LytTR family DNA-binding domain-containing protein [Marimonas arenosa]|uniref:LytTR family transcriptional regulator n=1 Tax=Marimonas arenosa TaxID=1795305 RepID=A0AAE3WCI8_9RHOB|nr:LytTR family DNA-binding domain-containing protein [Marimonas arenosa]MDQ2090446.1 LytTR family transcriptional regulator [Marimonas arenosa]